MMVIAPGC